MSGKTAVIGRTGGTLPFYNSTLNCQRPRQNSGGDVYKELRSCCSSSGARFASARRPALSLFLPVKDPAFPSFYIHPSVALPVGGPNHQTIKASAGTDTIFIPSAWRGCSFSYHASIAATHRSMYARSATFIGALPLVRRGTRR